VTEPNPLINLLSISAEGQAVYITEVMAQAEGYDHYSAEERKAMLFGYIIGLSVALKGDPPFAKAELAARIEELENLMSN
jgi:hypothetical protein